MIVVKIELHSAITGNVRTLGVMHVSNDGVKSVENPNRGTYDVELKRAPDFKRNTRTATVTNWPRLSKTVWQLLQKALNNLYPLKAEQHERTNTDQT